MKDSRLFFNEHVSNKFFSLNSEKMEKVKKTYHYNGEMSLIRY